MANGIKVLVLWEFYISVVRAHTQKLVNKLPHYIANMGNENNKINNTKLANNCIIKYFHIQEYRRMNKKISQ